MRKLIAAIFLATSPAAASETELTVQMICAEFGALAEVVMTGRQMGVPLSSMMTISEEPTIHALIRDAYEVPRFSTDRNQKNTILDFRNEAELFCYNSFN